MKIDKLKYSEMCGKFLDIELTEEIDFLNNWNWIMEVVEKIRNSYFQGLQFQFKINDETGNVYIVHHLMDNAYFIQVLIKDKLKEAVVQAIWEFLQWYNEQK